MKNFWSNLIDLLLGRNILPIWAYGLECYICQMTFINEQAHYDHVMENLSLYEKHMNKIPILK
jgi:hypothetical protein